MKHVVNWTIGSFFRTIGRIIAYIIVGALVAFALSYKPKAATLTSKAVYTDGYWYSGDYNNWGSNNTYNYGQAPLSINGKAYYDIGNINTTYSGQAYQLAFGFQYNLTAQKYYDITFNFKSRDLTSNLTTSGVHLVSGVSSSTLYDTDHLSLIGVTNNATTGNNTNKLVVRIYAVQPLTYWAIELKADPNNLTSVNNFGIASISIDEVDTTNSQEIINNQTNNTQNIINNQNNATQQIIDSQSQLLGKKCENLYNPQNVFNGYINTGNTSIAYETSGDRFSAIVQVDPNTTYTISKKAGHSFRIATTAGYPNNNTQYLTTQANHTASSMTITTGSTANYLVIFFYSTSNGDTGGYNNQDLMVVKGSSSKAYCEYGSYSSKLDETNDLLNNDDTSSATNQAGSFFSNFTTNTHGLTSIITAPLSAIQSLTSATCSPLVLPLPFVNSNLTLPCMRPIYVDNFGGFMTLYDTITLGIVSYWILVRIFALVKDFKNPEHDEVEVMDL